MGSPERDACRSRQGKEPERNEGLPDRADKKVTKVKCAFFIATQNGKPEDMCEDIWHVPRSQRPGVRTSGQVVPELLAVPLAQEITAALVRLHSRRVHRCDLGFGARTVHTFVPLFDHLLKLTTFNVFGTGANFQKLVPVEVRDLVANRKVGQFLGTTVHVFLEALVGKWSTAFSKGSSFVIVMP